MRQQECSPVPRIQTHYECKALRKNQVRNRPSRFQEIVVRLASLKLVAFCRRAISSNLGCRHFPGEGLTVDVPADRDFGVEGIIVAGVDLKRPSVVRGAGIVQR